MDIVGAFKNFFAALAAGLGWGKQRDAEVNTPGQQANAQAKTIQEDRTKAAADVANPDPAAFEKDVAE